LKKISTGFLLLGFVTILSLLRPTFQWSLATLLDLPKGYSTTTFLGVLTLTSFMLFNSANFGGKCCETTAELDLWKVIVFVMVYASFHGGERTEQQRCGRGFILLI
jgi:hypothetical protein